MKQIKKGLVRFADSIGGFASLRYLKKKNVTILMYHRFSNSTETFKLQKDIFEKQVRFFKNNYAVIRMKVYEDFLWGRREKLPDNSLIITIDDGFMDNFKVAYPVLKKYDAPAIIYLSTDFVFKKKWLWSNALEYILQNSNLNSFSCKLGKKEQIQFSLGNFKTWHATQLRIFDYLTGITQYERVSFITSLAKRLSVVLPQRVVPEFEPLNVETIQEMNKSCIDFGSHTCTHSILSQESKEDVQTEVSKSKKQLENILDSEVTSFCYPNGRLVDFNLEVIKSLRDSGYKSAVTTLPGTNTKEGADPFMLKRSALVSFTQAQIARDLVRF